MFGPPPKHAPSPSHASAIVQYLPSSQDVPFGAATTTHDPIGPISWPMLHTAILHGGVLICEQSCSQAFGSPLELLLLLLLLDDDSGRGALPTSHPPTLQSTGTTSPIKRAYLVRPIISSAPILPRHCKTWTQIATNFAPPLCFLENPRHAKPIPACWSSELRANVGARHLPSSKHEAQTKTIVNLL